MEKDFALKLSPVQPYCHYIVKDVSTFDCAVFGTTQNVSGGTPQLKGWEPLVETMDRMASSGSTKASLDVWEKTLDSMSIYT